MDYVPRLRHRQLPLHSGTLLCKDPARPRPPPSPRPSRLLSAADNRRRSRTEEARGPLFCPLLCSLLGVSLGGGWGLRPPQHLLRMAGGGPCSSSPGRKPSEGYQGHHGSKCPKGQVKAPGDEEAPRLQSPCPLCAARPSSCWSARPSGPGPSSSSTPTWHPALVSPPAAGTVRHPAPPPTSRLSHREPAPLPVPAPPSQGSVGHSRVPTIAPHWGLPSLTPTLTRLSQAPQGRSASPRPPVLW